MILSKNPGTISSSVLQKKNYTLESIINRIRGPSLFQNHTKLFPTLATSAFDFVQ